jgi:hypothetical protein
MDRVGIVGKVDMEQTEGKVRIQQHAGCGMHFQVALSFGRTSYRSLFTRQLEISEE